MQWKPSRTFQILSRINIIINLNNKLFKVLPDLCGKITLCSKKVRGILVCFTSIGVHKKPSRLWTVENSSTRVIQNVPGQIILVKQVNILVYLIEVRYLSLM